MTAMCGRCANWRLTVETPLSFRRSAAAPCALDKPWTFFHATKGCAKFAPASDADVRRRRVVIRDARQEVTQPATEEGTTDDASH